MNYLTLDNPENTWGLDIEANSLTPDKIWVVCLVNYKTKEGLSFRDAKSFKDWLKANKDYSFVTHNGLKSDIPWLNSLWSTKIETASVIDTFVLSQLFDPNLPKPEGVPASAGTHSLQAWGVRVKSAKIDFHDYSKYSEEMLKYCFQDVKLTLKVYKQLAKQLKKLGFSEQSVEIEHLVTPIIGKQQRDGFYFDHSNARELLGILRGKQSVLGDDISQLFSSELRSVGRYNYRTRQDGQPFASYVKHAARYPSVVHHDDGTYECFDYYNFNIGSAPQRLDRLTRAGYQPTSFSPKGTPKVDEEALVEFAKVSGIKEVQYIADWLVLEGRCTMIEGWLNNLGDDSCIHGNVFTCGAQSRRMKHSSPNTANIPSVEAKYGKECRSLWISRPGRVLVGVDAVALEGRMLLHYLNSPEAYDFFINGDPHQSNSDALAKAGLTISRKASKNYFYGFMYGAGNAKLASMYGTTDTSVGETIRHVLETNVPGLGNLIKTIQQEWKDNDGLLQCIDGGYVRCPSKSACLNYKLQPAGAILMKQALIIADRRLREEKLDYMFVGNIHDEVQIDCKMAHAHKVGETVCEAIKEAGKVLNFNVPQAGSFSVGFNWAETH